MMSAQDDEICGVPVAVAPEAVRIVEPLQWCSVGVPARELRIDLASSRSLLQALEFDGRLTRFSGMLPPGHDGAWLPEEEDCEEPLVIWHLRYPAARRWPRHASALRCRDLSPKASSPTSWTASARPTTIPTGRTRSSVSPSTPPREASSTSSPVAAG
jgi:hypothetical protein